MKTVTKSAPIEPQDLVIERREVIATIPLSADGTEWPVYPAFKAMAGYLGENLNSDNGIQLEFRYGEHIWRASAKPVISKEAASHIASDDNY